MRAVLLASRTQTMPSKYEWSVDGLMINICGINERNNEQKCRNVAFEVREVKAVTFLYICVPKNV